MDLVLINLAKSCRCESSSSHPVKQQAGSYESSAHSGVKHRAMEKRPLTSAMGLLRGYYGLASMSRGEGEGTEMATYKSDSENYSEDEPFSPIYRPPEPSNGRRYSTGDRRATSYSQARNSCDILMDSCWSVEAPATSLRDSSPLMKRSRDPMGLVEKVGEIQVVGETEPWTKEGPIRRRAKGEFGSDEILVVGERVNFSRRNPVPRPRDSNSGVLPSRPVQASPTNFGHLSSEGSLGANGMNSIEAALLGGKGAVESLISKVRQSASTSSLQDVGKPLVGILAPPGSGVLEGITSAYRRAKAALD